MKTLKLANSKKHFTIDDEDYPKVVLYDWFFELEFGKPKSSGRVCTLMCGKKVRLSRFILEVTDPKKVVDHIDRDPFNNVRSNLRICTQRENVYNRSGRINSSSKYKGVDWRPGKNKWRARIQLHGTAFCLGHYDSEIEAAEAYDIAAKSAFVKFAALNFPDGH